MSYRDPSSIPEASEDKPDVQAHGSILRSLGLGLITGAADDDCSAIGTYAAAGAKLGVSFLWTAPVTFSMMFAVVYLSGKLGQVTGQGLFAVIRKRYSGWILYPALIGVLVGNVFEAGADIGGMAAATLHKVGKTDIATAAEAAQALRPLAGDAAGILFALGVVGVGFLAVPVMTGGAAYDLSQALGWKSTFSARPSEAKGFYGSVWCSPLWRCRLISSG